MKMKSFKKTISFLLALTLFLCIPFSVYAYSGSSAITYADKYALSYNSAYRAADSDCANFVSQCLKAGGLPSTSNWYYNNYFSYSASWFGADSLKNYLKNDYGATRLVSQWTNNGQESSYKYINNSGNLSGNGKEIIFYDWNGDGNIDHTAICVGTGFRSNSATTSMTLDYGDLINQHTTDRKRVLWHLDEFNAKRDFTEIYAFGV